MDYEQSWFFHNTHCCNISATHYVFTFTVLRHIWSIEKVHYCHSLCLYLQCAKTYLIHWQGSLLPLTMLDCSIYLSLMILNVLLNSVFTTANTLLDCSIFMSLGLMILNLLVNLVFTTASTLLDSSIDMALILLKWWLNVNWCCYLRNRRSQYPNEPKIRVMTITGNSCCR